MTNRISPDGFLFFDDYLLACAALGVEAMSADAWVQHKAKALEEIPLEAKVDALEEWRKQIDAWKLRITGDGR